VGECKLEGSHNGGPHRLPKSTTANTQLAQWIMSMKTEHSIRKGLQIRSCHNMSIKSSDSGTGCSLKEHQPLHILYSRRLSMLCRFGIQSNIHAHLHLWVGRGNSARAGVANGDGQESQVPVGEQRELGTGKRLDTPSCPAPLHSDLLVHSALSEAPPTTQHIPNDPLFNMCRVTIPRPHFLTRKVFHDISCHLRPPFLASPPSMPLVHRSPLLSCPLRISPASWQGGAAVHHRVPAGRPCRQPPHAFTYRQLSRLYL
jgi:hypothetical protein